MLLTLLLLGCPKSVNTAPPSVGTPILPAPDAEIYTLGGSAPRDPLVAWVVAPPAPDKRGEAPTPLPYDEVLAGAAAGVGMIWFDNDKRADLASVRWAAYLAGWPYPVGGYNLETVGEGSPPTALLGDPAAARPEHERLGLARVRGPSAEAWVYLSSQVPVPVAAFSRDQALGATLTLTPRPPEGSSWSGFQQRVLSPSLQTQVGAAQLNEAGEWIVELTGDRGDGRRELLLRAPLYVGESTPADGPFEGVSRPPADQAEAIRQALEELDALRGLSGAQAVATDPMLAAVARKEAARLSGGGGRSNDREERVRAAGFPEGHVGELTCRATTVVDCLDGLYWAIDTRAVLLKPDFDAVGVGAETENGQLRLVIALAQR